MKKHSSFMLLPFLRGAQALTRYVTTIWKINFQQLTNCGSSPFLVCFAVSLNPQEDGYAVVCGCATISS